jgi:hypothetical protein
LHTHNLFQRLSIRHSMGYSKISWANWRPLFVIIVCNLPT